MHTMNDYFNVIGVMSGTSLDGIDLAQIQFKLIDKKWSFVILKTHTHEYTTEWYHRLLEAIDLPLKELGKLNNDYTHYLANVISNFIETNSIKNITFISSHGHTVLHQPSNQLTLQIGNLPKLATLTHQVVICDFRVQDVKFGGQGAPLVPIGDRLLFDNYVYCLNIGGFANISYDTSDKTRIAFDICPVNTVLNHYSSILGFRYDDKGDLARMGSLNTKLLGQLNSLEYLNEPKNGPKSLGFEYVKETILPLVDEYSISNEDKLHTYVEHVCIQVAKLVLPIKHGNLLITGGGAYNSYLINRLKEHLPQMNVIIPDKELIEFKEALIFAFLGVLRWRHETNVLSSVTGATHDHSSGEIYRP